MDEKTVATEPDAAGALPPSLLWSPLFIGDETVALHVPLIFWIVDRLRPARSAVLGVGAGTATFAICQSVDRSGTGGVCEGFGVWSGTVPVGIERQAATYPEIAVITDCDVLEEAAAGLEAESQNLIFADLTEFDSENDIGALISTLRERLAPDGALLLHGADRSVTGKSGVWVDTGSGMVILGKGDGLPASLKMLEDLSENGRLAGDMQCLLRRLGQAASLSFQARRATARLQPIETRLKAADTRAKELNAELSTLRLAYDARAAKLARSQLDLFAKEKEVSSFALKLEQTEPQLLRHQEAAERERKTRFDETAALTKMLEAKLEQISALEGSLKARDEREKTQGKQISSLQQRIEELKRQIQDMEAKPDRISALEESLKARDELAKTQAEQLKSQQQRVEQLKRQIKDMETSKSWRITAPIRAFRRGLKV